MIHDITPEAFGVGLILVFIGFGLMAWFVDAMVTRRRR
jgi:hypothetical protein